MNLIDKTSISNTQKVIKIPAQQMTRTSGYYANVFNMNRGKQEEVSERKYINVEKALRR